MRQAERPGQLVGMIGMHLEGDVDGHRTLVFVLDLGFGECRTAIEAPVDGFEALVEVAFVQNPAQRADFVGLRPEIHRQVGPSPVTEDTEADEVLLLTLDLLGGESAAQLTHTVGGDVLAVPLLDLVFDRQAVTIPPRDVGRVETGQRLRTNDDVLEDLVDRVADMNVAIGVGRTVVENETRAALRGRADTLVDVVLLPGGNPARFASGEVAAHGKWRVSQIEGFLVVSHNGSHNWK